MLWLIRLNTMKKISAQAVASFLRRILATDKSKSQATVILSSGKKLVVPSINPFTKVSVDSSCMLDVIKV